MAKLKKYAKAYNIDVAGIIEKDEFINKLVAARVSHVAVLVPRSPSRRAMVLGGTALGGCLRELRSDAHVS